jgi:hypothetical protein
MNLAQNALAANGAGRLASRERFPGDELLPIRSFVVIESAVAQVFGVRHGDLFRATRGRAHVARAREVTMYLAHVCCGLSFTEIGALLGRDRTTVAHACAVVEDRRDDPVFDRTLELLEWAVPSLLFPRRAASCWAGEAT